MNIKDEAGKIKKEIFVGVVIGVLVSAFGAILLPKIDYFGRLFKAPDDIQQLQKSMEDIEKDIEKIDMMNANIALINGKLSILTGNTEYYSLNVTKEVKENMKIKFFEGEQIYCLSMPTWDWNKVIGVNTLTQKEYKPKELINEKIFMPYTDEHGQEILFLGKFDENKLWDDECLINVYKNDKLVLIMEAMYDHGKLVKFEQVSSYITKAGQEVWTISNREYEGNMSLGECWNYYKDNDFNKLFIFEKAQITDLIDIDTFRSLTGDKIEGYYNGGISEGYYNDDTGKAYLVKYDIEGNIRTLYCGKIKNGDLEDLSGNAWYISKSESSDYMYYKGKFFNGTASQNPRVDKSCDFENPISMERIQEIVKQIEVDFPMSWCETSE